MDKLKKLAKDPKMLAYVGGGAIILFLLYRYFSSKSSASSTDPNVPAPDQTGLTAAEQVGAQEAADVTQLQSDIGALQGTIDQIGAQVQGLVDGVTNLPNSNPPAVATGQTKVSRKKHPSDKKPKPNHPNKPKPHHPKSHQSNQKHGGTGAVAPSHHHKTPGKKPALTGGGIRVGGSSVGYKLTPARAPRKNNPPRKRR